MRSDPIKLAIVAYPGLSLFEFAIAAEIFALPRPELGAGWYRTTICATASKPLHTNIGSTLTVKPSLRALSHAQRIILPGWSGIHDPVPLPLIRHLQKAHQRGAKIISLCSGIVPLAETGLLNGRIATTHWRYLQQVKERFPQIQLDEHILYKDHGDIATAAGSAAAIDLCLQIVREDYGPQTANKIARRLVVPPQREGGQAQYIETPLPAQNQKRSFGPLLDHLRAHLGNTHTVASMASYMAMSQRNFQRKFNENVGLSPVAWLLRQRIQMAKDLLETSPLTLDQIAAQTGLGTPETMRHHFRKLLRQSPSAYRASFRHTPQTTISRINKAAVSNK